MTDEKRQEFTLRISQANASQLVVILYEIFFSYTEDAQMAYETADYKTYSKALEKAHDCLNELIASLHLEQDLAQKILNVYFFVSARIGAARGSRKTEPLAEALKVMRRLYEIYKKDVEGDASPPIMGGAQTVYAGLTYGKNTLNVNCEDGSSNRGFYA